ncbi:hypothetical protein PRZ61_10920 [Halomonas pacifica]|uniref:hypothetical protein n=1 Tax=Bisbaumannia pacifica TaxID=77098 RepID=UPI002359B47B|nr:hypothetical protein [Halomonas pacifica]MDC8803948.1 hypothetical protein [Halomonas pacifica]
MTKRRTPFPLRLEAEDQQWIKEKSARECRSQNGMIAHLIKEARRREQQKTA